MKKANGITLVALVITIVVLIILASVVISMSISENGLFSRAKEAIDKYKTAEQEEQEMINGLDNLIEKNVGADKKTYAAYKVGDEVRIGSETFYVIKASSTSEDKVEIITKENIDSTSLEQSASAAKIAFSSDNYWSSDFTEDPFNLNEYTTEGHTTATVIKAARDYGRKIGGEGRLLTYEEAYELESSNANVLYGKDSANGDIYYWLGNAWDARSVWCVLGGSEAINASFYYGKNYGVRPVIKISKSLISFEKNEGTYAAYNIGKEVTIGSETFYVIKASTSSEDKVEVITKENIDPTSLEQSASAAKIAFSSDNYWSSDFTENPFNLNEYTTEDHTTATVIKAARDYGRKIGGEGRLLTNEEANELKTSKANLLYGRASENGFIQYWLGSAYDTSFVCVVNGERMFTSAGIFSGDGVCGVRPVIKISKSSIS